MTDDSTSTVTITTATTLCAQRRLVERFDGCITVMRVVGGGGVTTGPAGNCEGGPELQGEDKI